MADLTTTRSPLYDRFTSLALPLAAGAKAVAGCAACIDTSAHTIKPMAAGNANLVRVGLFHDTLDNSGGGSTVQTLIDLDHEIVGQWFDNATGGAAVTTLFGDAYMLDNHTVTSTSSGNASAGRVWKLDSTDGVFVVASSGSPNL